MKPLSDQISHGQSFVHAQKTSRDQFVPATDRRPFANFNKTFLRPLRDPSVIVSFFGRKGIVSQSQAMCDRGLRDNFAYFSIKTYVVGTR